MAENNREKQNNRKNNNNNNENLNVNTEFANENEVNENNQNNKNEHLVYHYRGHGAQLHSAAYAPEPFQQVFESRSPKRNVGRGSSAEDAA